MELIDKTELLTHWCEQCGTAFCMGDKCSEYERVACAPVVDAAPIMHGRWIRPDEDERVSCTCSNCGWESHLYEDDVYGMPYCPNCGAKMEENEV